MGDVSRLGDGVSIIILGSVCTQTLCPQFSESLRAVCADSERWIEPQRRDGRRGAEPQACRSADRVAKSAKAHVVANTLRPGKAALRQAKETLQERPKRG